MVRGEVDSGVGNDGGQPGDEVQLIEEQGVGAVSPGGLELHPDASVRSLREPVVGDGGPGHVADEALSPHSVVRLDGDARMEVEP
jgi:hypothetical protein